MSKMTEAYGGKISRPLDLLFGESTPTTSAEVGTNRIQPSQFQPRRYFNPEAQRQLTESIRQHGILQPLLVRPLPSGDYELVAGERRYRAAVEVGLETVPIVERELDDDEASQIALIENLQREDLNPVEETEGTLRLLALRLKLQTQEVSALLYRLKHAADRGSSDSGHNVMPNLELKQVEAVFNQIGSMTWESFVKNRLPLLKLPEDVLEALSKGQIEYTKARAIAQLKVARTRKAALKRAISENWSLKQIKEHIKASHPMQDQPPLRQQFETTYQKARKIKVWDNPDVQERLQNLLAELETLISEVDN